MAASAEPATPGHRATDWLWIAALPILLHWPHLTGWLSENPAYLLSGLGIGAGPGQGVLAGYPGWIDGNAGVTVQALGGRAAADWLAGFVPWWNPYSGVGLPLAAELQNGAFFMPFVLLLHGFDGVVFLKIVMQVLAGWASLALLKELGLCRAASMAGAGCFALNGSFAWFAHGPILPIAFLPLLLFGIERARRAPVQGALWVAVAIGWSLLAGFPEVAYLDALLGLAWTILRVVPDRRLRPLLSVAGGGLIGVAIAAPPLLAFAESLPLSFLSSHTDFAGTVLPASTRAALLLPYLFGPPMHGGLMLGGAAGRDEFIHWYRTAPYLDLPLLCLGALALRPHTPGTGLRWLLGIWAVAMLGRAIGVPGLSAAVDALPLLRNTMAHLYVLPSCQMALTILAALAIDDWRKGRGRGGSLAAAAGFGLALAGLPGGLSRLRAMSGLPHMPWFPALSVAAAAASLLALALLLNTAPTPRRGRLLVGLLVGHAALLCFIPLLCGKPRPRGLDTAAIAQLRALPPFVRVHAVGSLTANYGAWFGIAAIDHNYLPVPRRWVDDVRATLLPGMDGVNNHIPAADETALAALPGRLPALAAHGVGVLLLPPSASLSARITVPVGQTGNVPAALTRSLHGIVRGARVTQGAIGQIAVMIGTLGGAARGMIHLQLCQGPRCAEGSATLAGAADNADLTVALGSPLAVRPGLDLSYTIDMSGSGRPAVVWLWPNADPMEAIAAGRAPRLVFTYIPAPGAPAPLFRTQTVAAWRLPDAAPYVEAPGCRLTALSRTDFNAECAAPARLLRRELFYPGWRARIGGRSVPVGTDGLYQSVALPSGRSRIVFTYAPPRVAYAWVASAAGLVLLALLGLSSGRSAMIGRSIRRLSA